jgi:hypothetical protein
MSADDNAGLDHYRRERSRQLRQLEMQNQIVAPLEKPDSPPAALFRSGSSPSLFDLAREAENAPKVPPIVKAKPSASFSLPRIHNSVSIKPQSRVPAIDPGSPTVSLSNMTFEQNPAFAKHLDKLHFLIPGRLAYVAMTPSEISDMKDDARLSNASVVSSYLHRQYVPLCADFGPVALNVVHRFCQVPSPSSPIDIFHR